MVLIVNAEASHLDFLFRARCTELTSDWASLTAPWCLSPHAQEEANALSNTSFDEFSWQHDFLDFFVTSFFVVVALGALLIVRRSPHIVSLFHEALEMSLIDHGHRADSFRSVALGTALPLAVGILRGPCWRPWSRAALSCRVFLSFAF